MKSAVIRGVLAGVLVCLTAAAAVAQSTKTLSGTVVQVDGKTLVVKMSSATSACSRHPRTGVSSSTARS